jgi:nucleoside-diphosphate-sugar epimerase
VRTTSNTAHLKPHVDDFHTGDQSDPQTQAALVHGVDAIIHNSADSEALRRSPESNYQVNVLGSLRLLEAARQANVGQLLFVSSVAVYHSILPDRKLDENHPTWPSGIYGAYKAAIEPHLIAYQCTYGMNTSSWRPAAIYGIAPDLKRSQWYDLTVAVRRGDRIANSGGGKITHVQDVADALALAIGDESVAGQFYNLVDRHMYWQQSAEFAKELTQSSSIIENERGPGPKNTFDTTKAVEFFTRHQNEIALRRGLNGVREYIAQLLEAMPPSR